MFSKYGGHDLSKFGVHDESHGFFQGSIMMHNFLYAQGLSDYLASGKRLEQNTYTLPIVEEQIVHAAWRANWNKHIESYVREIKSILKDENKTLLSYIEGIEYSNRSFESAFKFGWASFYEILRLQALKNTKQPLSQSYSSP